MQKLSGTVKKFLGVPQTVNKDNVKAGLVLYEKPNKELL